MQELLYIGCCLVAVVLISGYNVVLMNSKNEIAAPKGDKTFPGMKDGRARMKDET